METIREVIASLAESARQRVGNPLTGAFLIAWVAWNFRLLLVISGEEVPSDKIRFIDETLYPCALDWVLLGLLYPFLSAAIFVGMYPFLNRLVLIFYRTQQKETLEKVLAIEGKTPLTQEEADKLRRRMAAREVELKKECADLREELEMQREVVRSMRADSDTASSPGKDGAGRPPVPAGSGGMLEESGEILRRLNAGANAIKKLDLQSPTLQGRLLRNIATRGALRIQVSERALISSQAKDRLYEEGLSGEAFSILLALRDGRRVQVSKLETELSLSSFSMGLAVDWLGGASLVDVGHGSEGQSLKITPAGRELLVEAVGQAPVDWGFEYGDSRSSSGGNVAST